jgi:hypothetical protein
VSLRQPSPRVARGVVAVALALLGPRAAWAQTGDDVRAAFNEGVALLEQGRYADAVARFERVAAARETPAVLYNLALAERGVGRYVSAVAHLERWLTLAADRAEPARVAEVRAARDECRAAVATLTLRGAAPGLALTVDDVAARAEAPLALDPGEHAVRARAESVEPFEARVTLRPGERRELAVAPSPRDLRTALRVETNVADAEVLVDGQLVGRGVYGAEVLPGRHTVRVRAPSHAPWEGEVTVVPGRPERLSVVLDRRRAVYEQWWFWTGLGVVLAGAAVALGVALRPTEPPLTGTLGVNVEALRFP